jgi:uncharacterized membrane protein
MMDHPRREVWIAAAFMLAVALGLAVLICILV